MYYSCHFKFFFNKDNRNKQNFFETGCLSVIQASLILIILSQTCRYSSYRYVPPCLANKLIKKYKLKLQILVYYCPIQHWCARVKLLYCIHLLFYSEASAQGLVFSEHSASTDQIEGRPPCKGISAGGTKKPKTTSKASFHGELWT